MRRCLDATLYACEVGSLFNGFTEKILGTPLLRRTGLDLLAG